MAQPSLIINVINNDDDHIDENIKTYAYNPEDVSVDDCKIYDGEIDNIKYDPDDNCPICYENLNIGKVTKTTCEHIFHKECLDTWLNKNISCPCCRSVIDIKPKLKRTKNFHIPQSYLRYFNVNSSQEREIHEFVRQSVSDEASHIALLEN